MPAPIPPRVGRKPGAKNKIGAMARDNISAVFIRLGGTGAMAEWAAENKTEFYRIYARLLPIEHVGEGGGAIDVKVSWLTGRAL